MRYGNEFINAEAPALKKTMIHLMAEITEPFNNYNVEMLETSDADIVHQSEKGNYLRTNDKKYITVGVMLKNLDPSGRNYTHYKNSAFEMVGKRFKFENGQEIPLVVDVQAYDKEQGLGSSGTLEIDVPRKMVPYLMAIKGGYTPNLDKNIFINCGKYTGKIYMLLMQFAHDGFAGSRVIKLDDFRKKLGIPNDKYNSSFYNLSKKILDVAQEELERTTAAFTWNQGEKGGANRKEVLSIVFTLKNQQKAVVEKTDNSLKSHLYVFHKNALKTTSVILACTGSELLAKLLTLFAGQI